ncbi:RsmB/NOP family class I SAM-dependent RNA methyltransferase [Entomospira entomophila]|uniref:RsmB/NOP family class I SAM-dependent RNA methyltransferase n=1 Tax=Entomospira entomophila TaxID=2719988 RepID=A0A968G9X4_9SPIO|nr:RsmB/NOP family class I SAM-dependent RNA methyltransferase [Entomospira entomophilus]NIZ40510.1 RsmB/NOP family class I SAM-dependent RNA methyltransferase [Entomospira entomophilus]WDI36069.1 RsmB/NOP family class I SAM-dependent RNA methyltransferase [Entomospira entomophilus]
MIAGDQIYQAVAFLIENFEKYRGKADLLCKNHLRKFRLTKDERFFAMDLFYFYIRHRLLLCKCEQMTSLSTVEVTHQWWSESLDSTVTQWWENLSTQEQDYWWYSVDDYWRMEVERVYTEEEAKNFYAYIHSRAPTIILVLLRRNNREKVIDYLERENVTVTSFNLPMALQAKGRIRTSNEVFFDIQDYSSQLIALLINRHYPHLLDFCAGYAGKSVACATLWPHLEITASDIRDEVKPMTIERAKRAGIKLKWQNKKELKKREFSQVLVDAPCSGSGVWRRNPEDRYRMNAKDLEKLAEKQLAILLEAGRHVAIGGELLYVTCSFTYTENEQVIQNFLQKTKQFKVISLAQRIQENAEYLSISGEEILQDIRADSVPYLRIIPKNNGGDLFFAALLVRE